MVPTSRLSTVGSLAFPVAAAKIWKWYALRHCFAMSSQHHPSNYSDNNWRPFCSSGLSVVVNAVDLEV